MTTHLSPLLRKARRLELGPRELQTLAIPRGCRHCAAGTEPAQSLVTEPEFANEALAVALRSVLRRDALGS